MSNGQDAQSKQREIQEYLYRIEVIKSQLEALGQQGEIFEMTTAEIYRAKETLENVKNLDSDNEILIPLGGDAFISATVSDVKKILISVGANTIIEKDTDGAIEMLEKRLGNLEQMNQNIVQGIDKLQLQAADLNQKIQTLSQELQGQVSQNVPESS